MTTEQFAKIAAFMGMELYFAGEYWGTVGFPARWKVCDKTSLTDAEAVEAMNVLVEREERYHYLLGGSAGKHSVSIAVPTEDGYTEIVGDVGEHPTIPEAVAAAVLAMLEKEG